MEINLGRDGIRNTDEVSALIYYGRYPVNSWAELYFAAVKTLYIVDDVDRTAPRLLRSEVADHLVYLYVSDEEIGVDYREVYAVSASGNVIYPLSYDEEEGVIVFDYPSESTDVYIPDHIGNILHLSMSFR